MGLTTPSILNIESLLSISATQTSNIVHRVTILRRMYHFEAKLNDCFCYDGNNLTIHFIRTHTSVIYIQFIWHLAYHFILIIFTYLLHIFKNHVFHKSFAPHAQLVPISLQYIYIVFSGLEFRSFAPMTTGDW